MKTISFYQNTVPIANILLSVNIDEVIIYELHSYKTNIGNGARTSALRSLARCFRRISSKMCAS